MNTLIRRVLAVAGCVLLAGASVAAEEDSYVRGYIGEDGRYVPPDVRGTSGASTEASSWSARKKVYPEPIKEKDAECESERGRGDWIGSACSEKGNGRQASLAVSRAKPTSLRRL